MNSVFHGRLQQSPRKRIALDDVRRMFFEAHPELVASPSRGAQLLEALHALEVAQLIQLPAAGSWEKLGNPPLPNWIQLVRGSSTDEREDYSAIPWVPEMGFWPELKPTALESAKAINYFLLRRRGSFRQVPIKERSLEIFGDEKRLDTMRTGDTLFAGRMPLSAIGAFQVPLPLPYRAADAPGKPVLILENHNSFWSFGEWNHSAKRYSAVVYGAGEAFRSSGKALDQVLKEVSGDGAEYLGDLDPTGVRIPLEFNRSAGPGETLVSPALDFYSWLLENGIRRMKVLEPAHGSAAGVAREWLGAELGESLVNLWSSGQWVPQEALGLEALETFAKPTKSSLQSLPASSFS